MMTNQQMNEYLIQMCEHDIQDDPSLHERLFWDYRAWVLSLIDAGKDQLMSKKVSDSGSEAGGGGSRSAEQGQQGGQGQQGEGGGGQMSA